MEALLIVTVLMLFLTSVYVYSGFNSVDMNDNKVFVDKREFIIERVDEMLWVGGTCSIIGRFTRDGEFRNIVSFRCGYLKCEQLRRKLRDNLFKCGIDYGRL